MVVASPSPSQGLRNGLAAAASESRSQREFRSTALALIRTTVPFDAAVFHALSARVSLTTAVTIGVSAERLENSRKTWDDLGQQLNALRTAGNQALVVSPPHVFGEGSQLDRFATQLLWRQFRMRSLCMMHLIVREKLLGAVVLMTRARHGFTRGHVATLRTIAPLMAVADSLHTHLDNAPRASAPLAVTCTDERLTDRQRALVECVSLGYTNAETAQALGLSSNTVRNHLARIFERLGAANRAELVRLAVFG